MFVFVLVGHFAYDNRKQRATCYVKQMIKKYLTLFLAATTLAAGLSFWPAHAVEQSAAQYLVISPVKFDITLNHGQNISKTVTITNRQVNPVRLKIAFHNILANGDSGETQAVDSITPYDLKSWATMSDATIDLPAKASKDVTVTIAVPQSAEPGGHYGMLEFTPVERTDLPSVAIRGSVATLFLVRVSGPAKEAGHISDLYLTKEDGGRIHGVLMGSDLVAVTKVHNDGNVHFPTGPTVTITNQFGKQVFKNQTADANVFPQADRRFESPWTGVSTGYYTVKTSTAVPGNKTADKTIHVLVVTPRFAGLAILIIVLLIIIVVLLRRNRRVVST